MKVRELIERLYNEDQNAEVLIATDAEGNGHSIFRGFDTCAYREVRGEIELFEPDDGKPALVLYP
jgi:hypothetical protein